MAAPRRRAVRDELREVPASLQADDVPVLDASNHTVTHSLDVADPDGNKTELYIDVPGGDPYAHQ